MTSTSTRKVSRTYCLSLLACSLLLTLLVVPARAPTKLRPSDTRQRLALRNTLQAPVQAEGGQDQNKVTGLRKQVAQAVHDGDLKALLKILKQLGGTATNQIEEPVPTLHTLLDVLGGSDGEWLENNVRLLIACQVHRLAREVFLMLQTESQKRKTKVVRQLRARLNAAIRSQQKQVLSTPGIRFELDCAQAVVEVLDGNSSRGQDVLYGLVVLATDQPARISLNTPQELYSRVNHSQHRLWYEVVLVMEHLKGAAVREPAVLTQLQQLLHTHRQGNWHVLHAGVDALTRVADKSRDPELVKFAFYGQPGQSEATLPGLADCRRFRKFAAHDNWRIRAKVAESALFLSTHTNPKVSNHAKQLLLECQTQEEDRRVLAALQKPCLSGKNETSGRKTAPVSRRELLNHGVAGGSKAPRARANQSLLRKQHNLPLFDNKTFVGRKEFLKRIRNHLGSLSFRPASQVTRVLAINGMGGVGKSTLALAYAHDHLNKTHSEVWWIDAETKASLLASLRAVAERLGVQSAATDPEEQVLRHVHRELSQRSGWLIVLDNADDPTMIEALRNKLYPSRGGCVLITSRSQNWSCEILHAEILTQEEAFELLTAFRRPRNEQDRKAMQRLANMHLGRLPLALVQAGAYIRETDESFSGYLQLLNRHRRNLWKSAKPLPGYNRRLETTATLNLSLKRAEREHPAAARVACVMAYLASEEVPGNLLEQLTQGDIIAFNKALRVLKNHALIQVHVQRRTYKMHRLQQEAVRGRMRERGREPIILRQAVQLMQRVWVYDWNRLETWAAAGVIAPHVQAVWEHVHNHGDDELARYMLPLIHGVAGYRRRVTASHDEAARLAKQANQIARRVAPGSVMEAMTYNGLGWALHERDYFDQSINSHRQALKILLGKVGEYHSEVFESYSGLGRKHRLVGDFDKAVKYHKKALRLAMELWRDPNPHIAEAYRNLGRDYFSMGKIDQSIRFIKISLDIRLNKLDKEHPDISRSYYDIGVLYIKKGKYKKAIEFHQKGLEILIISMGNRHGYIAGAHSKIGMSYAKRGNYDKAIEHCEKALAIRQSWSSEPSLFIAQSYDDLGYLYTAKKYYKKAITCYKKAWKNAQEFSSRDNPYVTRGMARLGKAYAGAGNYEQALRYLNKALQIQLRTLNKHHPFLAATHNKLGWAYLRMNESGKAIEHLQKALTIRHQAYGKQHPETATIYHYLGDAYLRQGDPNKAIDYLGEALELRAHSLGNSSPDTQATREVLARARQAEFRVKSLKRQTKTPQQIPPPLDAATGTVP